MLSRKALDEFKAHYKKEFGKDIDDQTATDLGINLLTIFDKVFRPIKTEWLKEYEQQNPNDK